MKLDGRKLTQLAEEFLSAYVPEDQLEQAKESLAVIVEECSQIASKAAVDLMMIALKESRE